MASNESERDQERDWRNEPFKVDRFFFQITFGLLAIIAAVLIGFVLFPDDMGYRSNLYTTAVGVLITVSVLDLAARRREEIQKKIQRKELLLSEMRSGINTVARRAAEQLREDARKEGTLPSFRGEDFINANLDGIGFSDGDFQETHFVFSSLNDTRFFDCNFEKAFICATGLKGGYISRCNFRQATLVLVDLENTILTANVLAGADLSHANLKGVTFREGNMISGKTIMPDGTNWSSNMDMRRFTDPEHPNFWRSDDKTSPAYDGDDREPAGIPI
jgi:hypothetical protein